jgi:hypothetical protein
MSTGSEDYSIGVPQQGHVSWSPDFKFEEVWRAHDKAVEVLTRTQFLEALKQAVACGDFLRHVKVDTCSQAVTYLPYRREQELKSRIAELEDVIRRGREEMR